MRRAHVLFFAVSLLFVACGTKVQPTQLPQGTQEITGELVSVPLSVFRRGTHMLLRNDRGKTYVESKLVNLGSYEGKTVLLRGRFEPNTDPSYPPVFLVRSAESEEENQKKNTEEQEQTESGNLLPPATADLQAQPCGGPAGILCPDGMVCVVEDLREGIGHCRTLE